MSSDNTESAYKEYFAEMPFLALPYKAELKDELSDHYEIEGWWYDRYLSDKWIGMFQKYLQIKILDMAGEHKRVTFPNVLGKSIVILTNSRKTNI